MIARDGKLIFTILLQRHSPERFERDWQKAQDRFREPGSKGWYAQQNPRIHRYNDLAGFAEVYWDRGTRVDVDYFFLADRRTRFGKGLTQRYGERPLTFNSKKFYAYALGVDSGYVPRRGSAPHQKRKALFDALDSVQEMSSRLGCFVDLTPERQIVEDIDVNLLFSGGRFDGAYNFERSTPRQFS
jgi:hypothetical protein